jgi:formiminotetrahydrofolate cyclodeaminase
LLSGINGAAQADSPSFEFVESIDSHSSSSGGGAGKGLLPSVSVCGGLADMKSCGTIEASGACKINTKIQEIQKKKSRSKGKEKLHNTYN